MNRATDKIRRKRKPVDKTLKNTELIWGYLPLFKDLMAQNFIVTDIQLQRVLLKIENINTGSV